MQGRLVALRKQIAADKEATRVAQRRLAACEAVLRPTDTTFDEGLSRLAASLQEKETASGDVFVLSQSGARLEVGEGAFGGVSMAWGVTLCTFQLGVVVVVKAQNHRVAYPAPPFLSIPT